MGSGSEVQLLLEAQETLASENVDCRVVSMPSWELFRQQDPEYREEVLPPDLRARLAVEAGSPLGWCEWVGDTGAVIGVDRFGASAPGSEVMKHYGLTADHVVARAKELLEA
jgi:transketolase